MLNKIMLGILVVLLLITGGVGYYSYSLNQRLDELNTRLVDSESSHTSSIKALDEDLSALDQQITSGIEDVVGRLDDTGEQLDAQNSEIESAQNAIDAVSGRLDDYEDKIDSVGSQVDELDRSISDLSAEQDTLSRSLFDTSEVYDSVKQTVVRINDGQNTLGSGFIYDDAGHVLTAAHVIDEMTTIFVIAYDGSISEASVTGRDDLSDVAVLKMTRLLSISPVRMGDSSQKNIGDDVVAVGSPLTYPDTVTKGILSSKNRSEDYGWVNPVTNLLQFDAAINFGNSGCPLFDAGGEVIGLVVAITITEGSGINWAVSSNKVKRVADEIIANGSFAYPWVGVSISDLTPQLALDNKLDSIEGVLVTGIPGGGPADTAGILTGDIIIAVDDTPVKDVGELTSFLGEYKSPGENAKFDLIRNGTIHLINVVLGER